MTHRRTYAEAFTPPDLSWSGDIESAQGDAAAYGPNGHLYAPYAPSALAQYTQSGYEEALVVVNRFYELLRERILCDARGKRRTARAVLTRLIVLQCLLEPGSTSSLAAEARKLRCSRENLSLIAREFRRTIGLRAMRTNGDRSHLVAGRLPTTRDCQKS